MAPRARLFNGFQRRQHGLVAGRAQEFQETVGGNPCRAGIDERMEVDAGVRHQVRVQNDGDAAPTVVDGPERGYGARLDAPDLLQKLARAERNPAAGADLLVPPLEVDLGLLA